MLDHTIAKRWKPNLACRSSGWNSRIAQDAPKPSRVLIHPHLVNLVLNTLTIEYHETLSAAAGFQVEQAKQDAMKKYAGQYILVVEGSIPLGY